MLQTLISNILILNHYWNML